MSTPNSTLRQRGPKKEGKAGANGTADNDDAALKKALEDLNKSVSNEWDYKLALGIITLLAFVTRFFGISHPNEVVFDEVHFGKVRARSSIDQKGLVADSYHSSHLTTCNEPTSSTSTLPLESSFSPSLAGWSAMTVTSCSTTSANPTSQTMCPIWPFVVCLPSLVLLPLWSFT